jgi:hypothetical protein
MKEENRLLINLARYYLSNKSEMIRTAQYINVLSIKGLTELRRLHTEVPSDLIAHEQFLKDIISATAVYLAETNNWYEKNSKEETSQEKEGSEESGETDYSEYF